VLRDRLRRLGFPIEPKTPGGSVRSFYGRGKPTLYFHGHFDVVPAASPAQFQPAIRAGKLFGRGSSDMKGGLVAMIYAMRAIQECALKLDGRIALIFVAYEETGGARSSQVLAPQFEMCPGLLETRFYNRIGVPALAYGPGLLSVSHGPNEFVAVRNIFDCALIYALTAVKALSAHPGRLKEE